MNLCLEELSYAYGATPVLSDISLQLAAGTITALVGPNAVGKTTLLRCITGALKPTGKVLLGGRDVRMLDRKSRAQAIGYLSQETTSRAELTVLEAVLLGRLHTLTWRVSDEDLDAVYTMLEALNIADLALKSISQISGGQQQMVSIAQVLVQQPQVLLMDEPTNNLDLQHQLEMLTLVRELTARRNLITLISLHDLNLAARFADQIVVLYQKGMYAAGKPASVLTPEMLRTVYGVQTRINLDADGLPMITLLNSVRSRQIGSKSMGEGR